MNNFKKAKEIKIFDGNGNEWIGLKGLVNEANELDRFAVVGVGYKIAQHHEVYEIVDKTLVDLKLAHNTTTQELKEGARLRIDLKFPEIVHSIAGEQIQLWATFDNSYDSSTGLRLEINAYMPKTDTNYYCSEVISEQLNRYYHRHTKGLEVGMLEGTITKGIELFQNQIGKEFEQLVNTPVNSLQAKAFFAEMLDEDKKTKVKTAKKYLAMMSEALETMGDRITTAWALYSLISNILTKEVSSLDLRRNNARELLGRVKRYNWLHV